MMTIKIIFMVMMTASFIGATKVFDLMSGAKYEKQTFRLWVFEAVKFGLFIWIVANRAFF